MRLTVVATIASVSGLLGSLAPCVAGDLEWEVDNPFRFYKSGTSFALHEKAFHEVRGDAKGPLPADVIWRTERRLNDPDCKDSTSPTTCAATARAHYNESRLGWAAKTLPTACYDNVGRPRHYPVQCERRYGWGAAREDYVLPDAHTVAIRLSAERRAEVTAGQCAWSWQARGPNGKSGKRTLPCADKFVIDRVPYTHDAAASGAVVKVTLPDGRELSETVIVEDLLVVGIGDSFSSGDSNPDKPVSFSPARELVYEPNEREDVATRSLKGEEKKKADNYNLASNDGSFNPKALPRRLLEDEEKGLIYKATSREFIESFHQRNAQWMSADCHRSQYGYQFRVGLELALENRHRAVTMVHLACSGADVLEGLFAEMDAREQFEKANSTRVPAQFDQLADLICRGGAAARTQAASYTVPTFSYGDARIASRTVTMRWCPPQQRKRALDVVMLSIGGNDVGFSAMALYAMTESAGDIAPVANLIGHQIRFGTDVGRVYLQVLDRRIQAVKLALNDGFGVPPARVVQNSYEPLHYDETGGLCGALPTSGLDVHPSLKMNRERVREVAGFTAELLARLECMTDVSRRADCPAALATGRGTGFHLVTEHLAKFAKRGICARDPKRSLADGRMMGMPRLNQMTSEFEPYSPAAYLPYAHHWRLFRTANDAFLTANTHREGIAIIDIIQPAYAGLYSGAMHPTAEGHSMVADSVMPKVRAIVDKERAAAVSSVAN